MSSSKKKTSIYINEDQFESLKEIMTQQIQALTEDRRLLKQRLEKQNDLILDITRQQREMVEKHSQQLQRYQINLLSNILKPR